MKILLFDIDGTLIDSGGAGKRALHSAFHEVCGIRDALNNQKLAGKTDPQILEEVLESHGINSSSTLMSDLKLSYIENLQIEIKTTGNALMPGVSNLLRALKDRYESKVGLLTGNIKEGARIKLEPLGIYDYFTFGAYGSDEKDRNKLLPHARRRYTQKTGSSVDGSDFVVIGDTPRDVACAKPHGAISIAVATGFHSESELRAAGADHVLSDLTDTGAFIKLLG
jgi:phosphoglycolate phosphatase-like HAD superfamily hydrolase